MKGHPMIYLLGVSKLFSLFNLSRAPDIMWSLYASLLKDYDCLGWVQTSQYLALTIHNYQMNYYPVFETTILNLI